MAAWIDQVCVLRSVGRRVGKIGMSPAQSGGPAGRLLHPGQGRWRAVMRGSGWPPTRGSIHFTAISLSRSGLEPSPKCLQDMPVDYIKHLVNYIA